VSSKQTVGQERTGPVKKEEKNPRKNADNEIPE